MIIYLYGADTFRSRQKLKIFIEKFKKEVDASGINIDKFEAKNLTPEVFSKTIKASPFLANKRMIVIEDCATLTKASPLLTAIDQELKNLADRKIIVIFWDGEISVVASKYPLIIKLKKEKLAQSFSLLTAIETKKWASQQLASLGAKIDQVVLNELCDRVGNDLWRLNTEIQKLSAMARGKNITTEMVELLTSSSLEESTFALTDALSNKQTARALKLLEQQLKDGVSATEILGIITWQFRNLLLIKTFIEENGTGYPPQRIATQLNLHPFVVKKIIAQSSRFELERLKETYRRLAKTDFALKTSQADAFALLDLLIVK
jgi:DNA polymerase-3 subunit delta